MTSCQDPRKAMGKACQRVALAALISLCVPLAHAADMKLYRSDNTRESGIITVKGEIEYGDDRKLKELLEGQVPPPLVILDSPGGNLHASLGMGAAIRIAGSNTLVHENSLCASGCALAWLGGKTRLAYPTSKIALHAASKGTSSDVTASGNAMIGAYMARLGLNSDAIFFATSAEPSSFNYLTFKTARALGIEVTNLEELAQRLASREKSMGDDDKPDPPSAPPSQRPSPPPAPAPSAPSAPARPTPTLVQPLITEKPIEQTALALPDIESTLARYGISMDEAHAANIERAARAFWKRSRLADTAGMKESVQLCHAQAMRQKTPKTVSYCVALDIMATLMEVQRAHDAQEEPDPFLSIDASERRSRTIIKASFPMVSWPTREGLHKYWLTLATTAYGEPTLRN